MLMSLIKYLVKVEISGAETIYKPPQPYGVNPSPNSLCQHGQALRVHPANSETPHSLPQTLIHPSLSSPTQSSLTTSPSKSTTNQTNPQKLTMVAQTAAFKKAVEDSRKLKAKPNNDELLEVPAFSPLLSCTLMRWRLHTLTA